MNRNLEFIAVVIAGSLALAACGSGQSEAAGATGVRLVSPADAAAIATQSPDGLVILDIRTPEEFNSGHLQGATLLDFYEPDFAERLAELETDVPYLLYCRSGNRSGQTAELMTDLGFTDVAEVGGGIVAWEASGLALVAP